MLRKVLYLKSKTVTFSALLLATSSLLSKLLAIFRNNLLATNLPSKQTDIYFAAFRVPDLIYGVIISGGIVAAFLPIFATHYQKSKKQAQYFFQNVFGVFSFLLIFLSFLLFLFAQPLSRVIVPGFSPEQQILTEKLMRIMFLSPIIFGISAIFSGIVQYFNLFFVYALAPILYNIGIIIGILVFYKIWGLTGLAFGVILGALMHLLCQLPSVIKTGFPPRPSFNLSHPGLQQLFKLMAPRVVGSAGSHINLIVITAIASTISVGAVSIFNFANYLYEVPIGLFGISFAVAVFPVLSQSFSEKKYLLFSKNLNKTFINILFLVVPVTIFIFILRTELVYLFYGTSIIGNNGFNVEEILLTSACLGLFVFSLIPASLIPLLWRAFFAAQDTKTPVKIALLTVTFNIALAFLFTKILEGPNLLSQTIRTTLKIKNLQSVAVLGLPLALTACSWLQFLLLLLSLKLKITFTNLTDLLKPGLKIIISGILSTPLVGATSQFLSLTFGARTGKTLIGQIIVTVIVGSLGYLLITICLGSKTPSEIWRSLTKQFKTPTPPLEFK